MGTHRSAHQRTQSTQEHRQTPGGCAPYSGCDHLPVSHWLLMEPHSPRLWRRRHHSSHFPALAATGLVCPHVGDPGGGMRRLGSGAVGMASSGCHPGQSAYGGDRLGPNPTDRGEQGSKRSLLTEGGAAHSPPWWRRPMYTTRKCLNRPWKPSWWSVRN